MQTTTHLLHLANQTAQVYTSHPEAKAMLLAGSVAKNTTDQYSDLDLMLYYNTLPNESELQTLRVTHGSQSPLWVLGSRETGTLIEAYNLAGVQHQIVHTTIAAWEETISSVLDKLDMNPTTQKALGGMLEGTALYGNPIIAAWQAKIAAYPTALQEAMIRHHLQFFPLWGMQHYFSARDSRLWVVQILLEAAHNILGVLAGLNRVYFSSFQLKRIRAIEAQFTLAPTRLAARLEQLFVVDFPEACHLLETLVDEVVGLVETHMKQIDTDRVRSKLGWRQQPWDLPLESLC
jgi:hypothetical protein